MKFIFNNYFYNKEIIFGKFYLIFLFVKKLESNILVKLIKF